MKKIITLVILLTITSLSYGQALYNNVLKVDKFNDVIQSKEVKTLIYGDTSTATFTIETKGQTPLTYCIKNVVTYGSAEEPINLVDDVWGYEYHYFTQGKNSSKPYILVYRTITTQYTKTYLRDLFWVEDVENGSRTIYQTIK